MWTSMSKPMPRWMWISRWLMRVWMLKLKWGLNFNWEKRVEMSMGAISAEMRKRKAGSVPLMVELEKGKGMPKMDLMDPIHPRDALTPKPKDRMNVPPKRSTT
jgi:hypothetical protein